MNSTICHITSVHPRTDTRIYVKQAQSLAQHGYKVSFIVADGLETNLDHNVETISVKPAKSRLTRMLVVPLRIFFKALSTNANIYHFHDPELIFIGVLLRLFRKKVIYDVHEDVPKQILSKPYLSKFSRIIISKLFMLIEKSMTPFLSGIITATDHIKERIIRYNSHTISIKNYPKLSEFDTKNSEKKYNQVCYVGGISITRGILEMIQALPKIPEIKLIIAGAFDNAQTETKAKSLKGWQQVEFVGWQNREQVSQIISESAIGLVTLHPIINYVDALPVKLFEYMACGTPVIASNFPLWESILNDCHAGITVDPLNPSDIANAISSLLIDKERLIQLGNNGKKATKEKYRWKVEEQKLLEFYDAL